MAACDICGQEYSGFWSFFSLTRNSEESFLREMEGLYDELADLGINARSIEKYPASLCTDCLISKNAETKEIVERLGKEFVGVQRGDFIRGAKLTEIGWIKVDSAKSPSDFENSAKRLAILAGANALIKSNWTKQSKSYLKGYSKNGNPYYGTEYSFQGEALAVKATFKQKLPQGDEKIKPLAPAISPRLVVLDASNIARERPADVRRIRSIARELRKRGTPFIFIFDANFAYQFDLPRESDRLLNELGLDSTEGSVVPSGSRADDFVIQLGEREGAVIVTNDHFRDRADRLSQLSPERLMKFMVVTDAVLIPDLRLDVTIS